MGNYPGESLAALCDYCRDWLRRDVLPGYRDIDFEPVDLEAWFADRDVQTYVEALENKGALGIAKSSFSFLSSFSGEKSQVEDSEEDLDSNTNFGNGLQKLSGALKECLGLLFYWIAGKSTSVFPAPNQM